MTLFWRVFNFLTGYRPFESTNERMKRVLGVR